MSTHDRELIDRYLADQLSSDELTTVEARIVMDRVFRHEVDVTEGLRAGLARLHRSGDVESLLLDPSTRRPGYGPPGRVLAFLTRPAYAMAATVAALGLGLLSVVMFGQLQHARTSATTARPPPAAATPARRREPLSFATLRNGDSTVSIRPSDPAVLYDLSFDVGAEPAARYSITISRVEAGTRTVVLEVPRAATDDDGRVRMSADSVLLPPGTYAIRLEPGSDDTVSGTDTAAPPVTYSLLVIG